MRWSVLFILMLFLAGCNLFHDTVTVTGRVNDTQGNILEGVDITAEGVSATTNDKGYYRLWNVIIDGLVEDNSAKIAFSLYYPDYGYYRYIREVSLEDPRMDFTLDKEFASAAPLNDTVVTEMIKERILKEREEKKLANTSEETGIMPAGGGGGGGAGGSEVTNETKAPVIEAPDESDDDIYVNVSGVEFDTTVYYDDEDHFGLSSFSFTADASRSSGRGILNLELRSQSGSFLDSERIRFNVASGQQVIESKDEEGVTDDIEYLRTNQRGEVKLHAEIFVSNQRFLDKEYDIVLGVENLPVDKGVSLSLEEAGVHQPMVEDDPNVSTRIHASGDITLENTGNTPVWGRCIRKMHLEGEEIAYNETGSIFYLRTGQVRSVPLGLVSIKKKPQFNESVMISIEFIDDESDALAYEEYFYDIQVDQ